jgi:DNA invertase Pin-like site-specific DNA recombinase
LALLGYARVSTPEQDLSLQQKALREAGCTRVFAEKVSGIKDTRPQLARLMKTLEYGDVVVVTRLDRLARSTLHLLRTVDAIIKAGAQFRSLADSWCDTTTAHGKLLLTVLAGLSEFERSLIVSRTQAGILRARELGVAFGRKPKLNPKQRQIIAERYQGGETMAALAHDFGCSEPTIWRALRRTGEPAAAPMAADGGAKADDVIAPVLAPAARSGPTKLIKRPTG